MKKVYITMFLAALIALPVFGQSIADQLSVTQCSFRFYDGPTELDILDQMVTVRAVESSTEGINSWGRVYHIEFTYKGTAMELANARVEFLDEHKRPLHAIQIEDTSQYMKVDPLGNRPNPRTRYIALSLKGIPLRLLDQVVSIRIVD